MINRKHLILVTITVAVSLFGGELFARYFLGLGTPPLLVTHPRIEYMFARDQDVYRFGNRIVINQYGMRTAPFTANSAEGFRIMVFGDSVLNGGALIDHTALATTILQKRLAKKIGRKVIVGNVSANSWGPGNWLAYAKEFGFFNADVVALVISSHDYADNPTFQPLNENTHPTKKPASALLEGFTRYLSRYLPQFVTAESSSESEHIVERVAEQEIEKGLKDLRDFLILAKNSSKFVLVLQHWRKEEIERGKANLGNQLIREVCESEGIFPIQLGPYFQRSIESGINSYRDNIHPNQIGQKLIARALLENLPNEALHRTR